MNLGKVPLHTLFNVLVLVHHHYYYSGFLKVITVNKCAMEK